jgi:hypothetical protein
MRPEDPRRSGASFGRTVGGKNASGYCNVDGRGNISEFTQW